MSDHAGGVMPGLVERALADLWPDGVPEGEVAFWASLSPDARRDLVERVGAITAASEPGADLERLARGLSMGRTGFYSLRRRWVETRSLKAVARFATRQSGRRITTGGTPSGSVDEERGPEELRRRFGREFVLDVSAVDLVVLGPDGPEWLVCAFLLERSSGLILAAAPGAAGTSPPLGRVAGEAAERALELRLTVRSPTLSVVLPDARGDEFIPLAQTQERLARVLGEARVAWSQPRRFGAALVDAVGERVGELALRRRADFRRQIAESVARRAAAPSPQEIEILLRVEVRRSNELVERRLRRLGLVGGGGDPTPLVKLLDAAFPEAGPVSAPRSA